MENNTAKLNKLRESIEEVFKEHGKSDKSNRLKVYMDYLANDDIYKSARLRFFNELLDYQFLLGDRSCKISMLNDGLKKKKRDALVSGDENGK